MPLDGLTAPPAGQARTQQASRLLTVILIMNHILFSVVVYFSPLLLPPILRVLFNNALD